MLGPLLHLPRQLTGTTGTLSLSVRKEKVAIVASEPFSRHHLFVHTNTCALLTGFALGAAEVGTFPDTGFVLLMLLTMAPALTHDSTSVIKKNDLQNFISSTPILTSR